MIRFVLASASPARLDTLRRAGVEPEIRISGVDESQFAAGSAGELAQALAEAKARAVRVRIDGPALILGCDSLLEFDGAIYGKPGHPQLAAQRWAIIRGRSGVLHTGHALLGPAEATLVTVSTTVRFAAVTDEEIALYCASGEPEAVAGGFTIDGLGGWFVEQVTGDPHNVVGISLPTLRTMLQSQGYQLSDIGYPTRG